MVQVHLAPRDSSCCSVAYGHLHQGPLFLPGGTTPRTPRGGLRPQSTGGRRLRNPPMPCFVRRVPGVGVRHRWSSGDMYHDHEASCRPLSLDGEISGFGR